MNPACRDCSLHRLARLIRDGSFHEAEALAGTMVAYLSRRLGGAVSGASLQEAEAPARVRFGNLSEERPIGELVHR